MPTSHPPKGDVIVMTRLNTVGLKRLAEGSLVERSPFDSRPPEPRRSKPPEAGVQVRTPALGQGPAPVRIITPKPEPKPESIPMHLSAEDEIEELDDSELGADASEDKTIMLGADGSDDKTVAGPAAAPIKTTPPPAVVTALPSSPSTPAPKKKSDFPLDPRLEMETPTTMFVKDIQATLKEEISKQEQQKRKELAVAPTQPVFQLPPLDIAPISESKRPPRALGSVSKDATTLPPPNDLVIEDLPTRIEPKAELSKAVPAPPTAKPSSLAPPVAKSTSSLPAPLPGQANRRKDPVGVALSTRPARIDRKGGFVPWAAALTALGVFVGVAGARIAMGAPFGKTLAARPIVQTEQPATTIAAEPGFAPRVVVPTEKAAEPTKPEPAKAVEPPAEKPAETKVAEVKPVEPKADTKPSEDKAKTEKSEKVEAKAEAPAETKHAKLDHVETKPTPRPHARRPAPPPAEDKVAEKPEPKPEPVAAKPKPEKTESKPEPAPKKSPDVAAAARDYAAVESQLGQSL